MATRVNPYRYKKFHREHLFIRLLSNGKCYQFYEHPLGYLHLKRRRAFYVLSGLNDAGVTGLYEVPLCDHGVTWVIA